MEQKNKKVFVGLSGGVDSSVSAVLLQEAGYDVVGVFIKVWQADFLPCTWREERREAMRAAAHLGIPFLTLDLEKIYKDEVVDYMIREYGAGRVPNPDVMCNKYVKFGGFLDFARQHGADYVATGHYARAEESHGQFHLFAGVDKEKDQSYFLWTLTQAELAHILFPVGHLKKSAVRALARKYNLPNAEKKDSQGLCFMGAVDMALFLKHYLKTEKGEVHDEAGVCIGTHDGALLYTIGQRRGFVTEKISANELPYFVTAKDLVQNTITVSHRDPGHVFGKRSSVIVSDVHYIADAFDRFEKPLFVRIRYHGEVIPVLRVLFDATSRTLHVDFSTPVDGVTAGQSIVFYCDDECMGGGVIAD